jgi:putative inorganic carbon (hco3(-)) transporter
LSDANLPSGRRHDDRAPIAAAGLVKTRRRPPSTRELGTGAILSLRAGAVLRLFGSQDLAFISMCLYLVVEYVRPQHYVPALLGLPLGQVTLGIAIISQGLRGKPIRLGGVATYCFLAFTAVILASCLGGTDPTASFAEFRNTWLTWVVIYLLIVNVIDTEGRFAAFLLLWLLCHYYMSQGGARQFAGRGFRFEKWGIIGQPGWFDNSGEFAIAMCMFVAVSLAFYKVAQSRLDLIRKAFVIGMPVTGVLGILGSSSRGAMLALGVTAAWASVIATKRKLRAVSAVALLAAASWLLVPAEQKERLGRSGEDESSTLRLTYWKAGIDMARNHPVFGIGYGNWLRYYGQNYSELSGGTVQMPHNIFIQALAELGFTGLVVFVITVIAALLTNRDTRRRAVASTGPPHTFALFIAFGMDGALIAYLVAGFFVTVLYYPFFWVNLGLTVALNLVVRQRPPEHVARGRRRISPRPAVSAPARS